MILSQEPYHQMITVQFDAYRAVRHDDRSGETAAARVSELT